MLGSLRPYLSRFLKPIARIFDINPNILTILSPVLCIAAAFLFYKQWLFTGATFIFFSGGLDVLDGAVARHYNRTSKFGAFLDSTLDRFCDAIIVVGLVFGGYCDWFLGILLIHSALTISYVKARGEGLGVECNVGIAERGMRLIIIMVGALIGRFISLLYFKYILVFLMIISYITVFQRIYHIWKQLKEKEE